MSRFFDLKFSFNEKHLATEILYLMAYSSANNRRYLSIPEETIGHYPDLRIANICKARESLTAVLKEHHGFEYTIYKQLNSTNQAVVRQKLADHLATICNNYPNTSVRTDGKEHHWMIETGVAFNATRTADDQFILTSIVLPNNFFENKAAVVKALETKLAEVNTLQVDLLQTQLVAKRSCCGI